MSKHENYRPKPTPDAKVIASDDGLLMESVAPAIRAYRDTLKNAHVHERDIRVLISNQLLGIMNPERRPFILDALHIVTGELPIIVPSRAPISEIPISNPPDTNTHGQGAQDMEEAIVYPVSDPTIWNKFTKKGIPKGPGRYSSKNGR